MAFGGCFEEGKMTDEQIAALVVTAESRAAILHASAAWGSDVDGHLMNRPVDVIEAQAAEIARLRAGIAEVKARGIAMLNEAHYEHQKYAGWGWKWAGEWLEALAQETQP